MAHRYFTTDIEEQTARITGEDAAHLARVLRAKPGDVICLCDGAGTDYDAKIVSADAQRVVLALLAQRPSEAEPGLRAEVFLGWAKGERMEIAVQKAVELGAASIQPFYSERTIAKPKNEEAKTARLARIAAEAAKQCGRGVLPPVYMPLRFEEMLPKAAAAEKALFFYEEGGQPLRTVFAGDEGSVALITGPEGGFSPQEAEQAAKAGCLTVGLGPRILRCETAPAVVLAAVMLLSGNLE